VIALAFAFTAKMAVVACIRSKRQNVTRRTADGRQGVIGISVMLDPKRSQWQDFVTGIAVIGSAMLGAVVLYLTTGLLLSVHLTS
jgi:hypothetical protein